MSKAPEDSILKTELTEEEAQLLAEISDHIASLSSNDEAAQEESLRQLSTLLETPSDTAVVAIPKSLKFVRRFFPVMKDRFARLSSDSPLRPLLADILALISITLPREEGVYDSLKYKLQGTTSNLWGHEFLRAIEGDIGTAVAKDRSDIAAAHDAPKLPPDADVEAIESNNKLKAAAEAAEKELAAIQKLVDVIVPLEMGRNSEAFACDLLLECDRLSDIVAHTAEHNWRRVGLYICSLALYQPAPDDRAVLTVGKNVYMHAASLTKSIAREALPLALRIALRLGDRTMMDEVLAHPAAVGPLRQQLVGMLARGRWFVVSDPEDESFEVGANKVLSSTFVASARALDHAAPKTPDDILKASGPRDWHSAQLNLARAFANGFGNAAHVADSIFSPPEGNTFTMTGSDFVHANHDDMKFTAVASLGLTTLWDVDHTLAAATAYLEASDANVRGGAMLAIGLGQSGVLDESEAALGLLRGSLDSSEPTPVRVGAILGLGAAYVGANHPEVVEELIAQLDSGEPADVYSYSALALGFVTCGCVNSSFVESAMALLSEIDSADAASSKQLWYVVLGLALSFLGAGDAVEPSLAFAATLHPRLSAFTELALLSFAYCGSGHVVVMQRIARTVAKLIGEANALDAAKKEVDERRKADSAASGKKGANKMLGGLNLANLGGGMGGLQSMLAQLRNQGAESEDSGSDGPGGFTGEGTSEGVSGPIGVPEGHTPHTHPATLGELADATPQNQATGGGSGSGGGGRSGGAAGDDAANAAATAASAADAAQNAADADILKRHSEGCKEREGPIAMGVLGIALVALGESYGTQMAPRLLQHILQLGTATAKQAVPLAMALLHTSHPAPQVMSLLEKFTHSDDSALSRAAIAAIGVCGAGSNNARATAFLRELSTYYANTASTLMIVRIALSLIPLGKGLLTLSPLYSDRFCVDRAAICGLMTFFFSVLTSDNSALAKAHYLPLLLGVGINPRLCMTIAPSTAEPVNEVPLLVGKAIDIVAQVGSPKSITGFHHHNAPVILHADSRAELRTAEYVTYTPVLEGIVLAEKNETFETEEQSK